VQAAVEQRGSLLAAWVFIAGWLLLVLVDTPWSDLIPRVNIVRVGAPALLLLLLLVERKSRFYLRGHGVTHFGVWIFLIAAAGMLSSALAEAPVLGYLKLALYLSMMVPLCLSHALRRAFDPSSFGPWHMALLSAMILAVSVVMLPGNTSGVFDNPNKLAMFGVYTWPLFAFMTRQQANLKRLVGHLGVMMCVGVCILTFSRGGMVGLAAGLVTYAAVRVAPTIRSMAVAFIVFGGCLGIMFLLNEPLKELAYKGRETFVERTRILMFEETMRAWSYRPILGYGFGLSWTLSKEDVDAVLEAGRMSWFTVEFGNSTLAMLSGGGIVITVLFYGLILAVGWRALDSLRDPTMPPRTRDFQRALFAGLVGMVVHAQAEAWLMAPLTSVTAVFWLYMALAAHFATPRAPQTNGISGNGNGNGCGAPYRNRGGGASAKPTGTPGARGNGG
jgi:O-antigen ligase